MVTQQPERRQRPEYSLARIRELAEQQAISYADAAVQKDIDRWDYSLETVCDCLRQLTEAQFKEAVRYSAKGPWLDVYLTTYQLHSDPKYKDSLYIKLKLTRDCLCVLLFSFHPEGK